MNPSDPEIREFVEREVTGMIRRAASRRLRDHQVYESDPNNFRISPDDMRHFLRTEMIICVNSDEEQTLHLMEATNRTNEPVALPITRRLSETREQSGRTNVTVRGCGTARRIPEANIIITFETQNRESRQTTKETRQERTTVPPCTITTIELRRFTRYVEVTVRVAAGFTWRIYPGDHIRNNAAAGAAGGGAGGGVGGGVAGVAGGALIGAAVGSVVPVAGTIVGGLVGAAIGGVGGVAVGAAGGIGAGAAIGFLRGARRRRQRQILLTPKDVFECDNWDKEADFVICTLRYPYTAVGEYFIHS